jgi:hypothetical protein
MEAAVVNVVALLILTLFISFLAVSLLWRVSLWFMPPVERLMTTEGLPIGGSAPEIAAHSGPGEYHLSFRGVWTFLVFGSRDCEPCQDLLRVASSHPATRMMRLVYVGDSQEVEVDCNQNQSWETYRFHDEALSREQWLAPVNPYFHVIDPRGRIAAKGIGNKHAHLDRLFGLAPHGLSASPAQEVDRRGDQVSSEVSSG